MADRLFTTFPFLATGTTTARTDPDRWSDIKNVKDYGAKGDGVTDDRAAIQAAVDYTTAPYSTANRGTIFFPEGNYIILSPITFELSAGITSISFIGAGGATITGNFADALLKRSVNSPNGGNYLISNLTLVNNNAAGKCILFHSIVGGKIVACSINGCNGVETYNSQSVTVDSCSFLTGGHSGGIGILAGNATAILSCDFSAFGEAVRHFNSGLLVIGGRMETNTIGVNLGVDQAGAGNQSTGVFISGISMESNTTGFSAGGGLSSAEICDIGISCSQAGKANGINFTGTPSSLSIRNVTVSNTQGWSGHAINIAGGSYVTLENVACGTTAGGGDIALATGTHSNFKCSGVSNIPFTGTAWTLGTGADIIFDRCPDAPIPTLANLPASSAVPRGTRRAISDSTSTLGSQTYGATAVGTGANFAPVWSDGTTWRYG